MSMRCSDAAAHSSGKRQTSSSDYENTMSVAHALIAHSQVQLPYGLNLIGY